MSESVNSVSAATSMTAELLAKHLRPAQQQEWALLVEKKDTLRLLDLPLDILQVILREVTHTNDLCSLALTHSTLHELVTPYIYSRFDIVWPDANPNLDTRIGVDALTYGLATLVMGHDVFGEAPYQQAQKKACEACNHDIDSTHLQPQRPRTRRGNYFAQYTRKFSLGNGPPDWVQEYLITKEGGKMLGTLVALAVGRMRNLEAFIWDMPTGVLRDVWLALASLGERQDGQQCRLEKVWVRWHDNQEQGPLTPPAMPSMTTAVSTLSAIPTLLAGSAQAIFQIPPYPKVEFPTFSILPPLRSLSVLDIDELPYAEEMSVLIEISLNRLEELRVGVAQHAQYDTWAAEDRSFVPPSPSTNENNFRPGGILGVITARFSSPFVNPETAEIGTSTTKTARVSAQPNIHLPPSLPSGQAVAKNTTLPDKQDNDNSDTMPTEVEQLSAMLSTQSLDEHPQAEVPKSSKPLRKVVTNVSRRMKLTTLELERVYLSLPVFASTIDWQRLRSLTLLGCRNHESFWKELRRQFKSSSSTGRKSSVSNVMSPEAQPTPSPDDSMLKITRIHTDLVSPALIAVIKDTLAPDTLEWLFLQEIPTYRSTVTIDMIHKAIRRHRGSLRKLLIDSGYRTDNESPNTNWRRWVLNRELITCITSGKMQLRELSVALEYKDWHFFLQRLPGARSIRSLHISHIADHVHGSMDAREAALQVLDIVALRPDQALCYLAVQSKCFEVLEQDAYRKQESADSSAAHVQAVTTHQSHDADDEDEDDPDDDAAEEEDDHSFSDMVSSNEEVSDEEGRDDNNKSIFKLREILFYDDKVSIFRARHGRL